MFQLTFLGMDIEIDLEPGIYLFPNISASGKTYLHDLLRQAGIAGFPVATYTYNDKLEGRPVDKIFVPDKYKVLFIDRYDMYTGDYAELIKQCANNSVILVDYKGNNTPFDTDDCAIILSEGRIEVSN